MALAADGTGGGAGDGGGVMEAVTRLRLTAPRGGEEGDPVVWAATASVAGGDGLRSVLEAALMAGGKGGAVMAVLTAAAMEVEVTSEEECMMRTCRPA